VLGEPHSQSGCCEEISTHLAGIIPALRTNIFISPKIDYFKTMENFNLMGLSRNEQFALIASHVYNMKHYSFA
jgi:hypothetical protein